MTRLLISIFVLAAAFVMKERSASAQSAYSYPWCLEYGIKLSCYYSSYEQCHREAFANGGFCKESPYYQGSYDRFVHKEATRRRRHHQHS
jgi:hypothetical protein